jgi:hypothetical protein
MCRQTVFRSTNVKHHDNPSDGSRMKDRSTDERNGAKCSLPRGNEGGNREIGIRLLQKKQK